MHILLLINNNNRKIIKQKLKTAKILIKRLKYACQVYIGLKIQKDLNQLNF